MTGESLTAVAARGALVMLTAGVVARALSLGSDLTGVVGMLMLVIAVAVIAGLAQRYFVGRDER